MYLLKKTFFNLTFNFFLFLFLMIGIQNSSIKKKVNLLLSDSVKLPISFIVGVSFISGSLTGSLFKVSLKTEK